MAVYEMLVFDEELMADHELCGALVEALHTMVHVHQLTVSNR